MVDYEYIITYVNETYYWRDIDPYIVNYYINDIYFNKMVLLI
jgi:hypothetical protein